MLVSGARRREDSCTNAVPGWIGDAKPFDAHVINGRVQRLLEVDIQRPRTQATTIHWAQHLDVLDGVEPEALG